MMHEMVSKLYKVVKRRLIDLRRAACGTGNYRMLLTFHKRFERYKVYLYLYYYFYLKWPIITFSFYRWMKWSEKEQNVHFHNFLKAI